MNTFNNMIQKCLPVWAVSSFLLLSTALAQGTATYELTFTSTWSASTHPTDFPSNPHFSGLIGGTHNSSVTFWSTGSTASAGIESMAETGGTSTLRSEVNQAISASNAGEVISGGGIGRSPGSVKTTFQVTPQWNLVTVTSMLAPSPDWFVGVSGLNLLDNDNNWRQRVEVDLFVYDAGTDSGPNYTSPNDDTDPAENISRIGTSPFLVDGSVKSVGSFVFELKSSTPQVSLSVDNNSVEEGEAVTVTIELSEALTNNVSIPLNLTPGTAESDDYDSTSPVNVTITGGQTEADHTINTYEDNDIQNESFTVQIDTDNLPSGVVAGSPLSAQVTITDDDVPEVSLSVDNNSVEEGETVTVTVELSIPLTSNVTIPLNLTSGTAEFGDYDSRTPVNVTITGGQTEADHTINTYEDSDAKDESFSVAIDEDNLPAEVIAGSPRSVNITITDPDVPEVSLSVDKNSVEEGESVTVTVELSDDLFSNVTIPLELTSGTAESSDYDSTSPINIEIISGQTEAEHTINTYEDDDIEDESFTVAIDEDSLPFGTLLGSPASADITIIDASMPEISLSVDQDSVMEGQSVTVTIELSESLAINTTIPLILTSGTAESDDYDSASPVNIDITSGQTEVEHTINTYEDADTENETFTVAIDEDDLPTGIILGSSISAEVTITDNDMPGILAPVSVEVDEGKSEAVQVSLMTQPSSDVTVTITGYQNTNMEPDQETLTFTRDNYNTPQTVTLITTEDSDLLNDEVTLTLAASGGGYDEVSHTLAVTIRDNMGVGIEDEEPTISITLWGNYPNPVSDLTKIVFDLPEPAQISIRVTDLLGRIVQTTPYGWYEAGRDHTVELGTDNLTSGVYYYTLRIDTGDQVFQRSKAMSIVR
ncbi:MAG: T9SS type A sorting domain-containing protein [Rhodothermaceae bacterium]|nr:T9SS type A sorting domain-containing protein [Rhodothermaceae bacterium]MYB90734.1 T9SS type A sorting domain-containing protein [Rhodothermaceae bacterium]MYG45298.1 T9SS type A sorting domain-containing protein [Rhodothermaceae bacterium]MYH12237.1 T9SS type A sorting domain-containing protein [Rhodothermaceae bacterium]MYJ50600.1 T9SS type A sorting domain-containing protein [Rhodothermaceae bacterium]